MFESKAFLILSAGFIGGVVVALIGGFSWLAFFICVVVALASFFVAGIHKNRQFLLGSLFILALLVGYLRLPMAPAAAPETPELFSGVRSELVQRMRVVVGGTPQAMLAAMTLGEREGLSDRAKEVLNRTGTRHIVAISGLHMAIVGVIVFKLLIFMGLWRRHAFWVSLIALGTFVLLVGAPPSAVRAGIMAALYLGATQLGRLTQAWRLLLAAAVIMLLVQPYILTTVSFQLSFTAVLGIILFKPWIDTGLAWVPWSGVRDLASVSLAAQLTTWPLIAYTFEQVSVVGIVANLIAVPVLPTVMVLGVGFLLVGWASTLLAKALLWPAWVVLRALFWMLEQLSVLPFAAYSVGVFGILGLVVYYGVLALVYWRVVLPRADVHTL